MTGTVMTAGRPLRKLEQLHTSWSCPKCGLTMITPLPSRQVWHTCGQGATANTVQLTPKED